MIRLYGVSVGNGSYARVTEGVKGALEKLGILSGFFPVDAFDDWGEYDGGDAPVSITIGPQSLQVVKLASTTGDHADRRLLLPLNSSWAPREMLMYAETAGPDRKPLVTSWLTPSAWSASKLSALTNVPVTVFQHGVEPEFCASPRLAEDRVATSRDGLKAVHLASTHRERKATVQVVLAWSTLHFKGILGRSPQLTIVLPDYPEHDSELYKTLSNLPKNQRDSIEIRTSLNLPSALMADFLGKHHLVVQPSRGEGFGMVPLEALSCGVPVVATVCTGHSEYLDAETPGLCVVPHGPDTSIDDGPSAKAPSVSVSDVAGALSAAWGNWRNYHSAAMKNAPNLASKWSWEEVTRNWAKREGWLS